MNINIIVAYDENRVIGKDGGIPWDLPADRRFFHNTTLYHPMIMGWNTWASFNYKPLAYRPHIILSRNKIPVYIGSNVPPIKRASNIEQALSYANNLKSYYPCDSKDIFIIGGAKVYSLCLEMQIVDKVIATVVSGKHDGDTYFPPLVGQWKENWLQANGAFHIIEYTKVK